MSIIIENEIINYLKEKKVVKTKDIQDRFNLTLSTTRRYLINLEQKKIIKRLFGEIVYNDQVSKSIDHDANLKIQENIDVKKAMASYAAKLIGEYKTIYLDAGSSCYYLLDYLDKDIEIFTNSFLNAKKAIEMGFKNINILGGKLKTNTLAIVDLDNDFINKINFDIAFIGVNGLTLDERLTTPELKEGIVKKTICQRSSLIVVLCEKEKFNFQSFYDFTVENKQTIVVSDIESVDQEKKKFTYILNVLKGKK